MNIFNPQQQQTLLSKFGYSGPADPKMMDAFLSSNPGAAAKMGQFSKAAAKMVKPAMAEGGVVEDYSALGPGVQQSMDLANQNAAATTTTTDTTTTPAPTVAPTTTPTVPTTTTTPTAEDITATLDTARSDFAGAQTALSDAQAALAADPTNEELQAAVTNAQSAFDSAQTRFTSATNAYNTLNLPSVGEVTTTAVQTPQSLLQPADVATITPTADQEVAEDTGQVGPAQTATATTVETTEQVDLPPEVSASMIDASTVSDEVQAELDNLEAARGTVSAEGTVRGQLEILMDDFEKDGTPPWASGAMRQAMSVMQSRGLGASSLAGQAVTQAAMEAAIGIAERDAATVAQFEMQNLNNEQETLIFSTQQRVSALLSDQAAENAARQFNAASENQTQQFMANMQSEVSRFNAAQVNAIRQFNAGESNAVEQFNAQMQNQRDQFNAQNSLIIAQANAQWRQNIATANTAAQNEANMQYATELNALTATALDQIWQRERDLMAFAFTSSESALERENALILADRQMEAEESSARSAGIGTVVGAIARGIFERL